MNKKIQKEKSAARQESEKILWQSLQEMLQNVPDDLKSQISKEQSFEQDLFNKINDLAAVQSQGDNLVMGLFDLELNEYVTINILSLITLLTQEISQTLSQNPNYSSISTVLSVCIFVTALLNLIQPKTSIELNTTDAKVYCILLNMQKGRPINEMIPYEEVIKCIKEIDKETDASHCLNHLTEKRLIRRSGNGFLVIREVKVKAV